MNCKRVKKKVLVHYTRKRVFKLPKRPDPWQDQNRIKDIKQMGSKNCPLFPPNPATIPRLQSTVSTPDGNEFSLKLKVCLSGHKLFHIVAQVWTKFDLRQWIPLPSSVLTTAGYTRKGHKMNAVCYDVCLPCLFFVVIAVAFKGINLLFWSSLWMKNGIYGQRGEIYSQVKVLSATNYRTITCVVQFLIHKRAYITRPNLYCYKKTQNTQKFNCININHVKIVNN